MERYPRPDGTMTGRVASRALDPNCPFEQALERALGEAVRAEAATDKRLGAALWCAMANVAWQHTSGATFSCTWRYAGAVVAALRQEGCYLDWYCCSEDYGTVTPDILAAMAQEGWTPSPD